MAIDTAKTAELREYVRQTLSSIGVSEKELAAFSFHAKCNRMGIFVFHDGNSYCIRDMGWRESECCTYFFQEKEAVLAMLINYIAPWRSKNGKDNVEIALALASELGPDVVTAVQNFWDEYQRQYE